MAKTESRRRKPATPKFPAELRAAIAAAQEKKAANLVVLDLRPSDAFTDYFVLTSGQSTRQVQTIADAIQQSLKTQSNRPGHVEGYDRGEWVLLDYFDFIVHVFTPATRNFYDLERLWGSAVRIEIPEPGP